MKTSRLAAALLAVALLAVVPVSAIIWSGPDGNRHPYVGLAVFSVDGKLSHLCSGTLLSPTVFLTAGHCTTGTDGALVSFDSTVSFDFTSGSWTTGTTHTHPDYDTGFPNTRDVGVIVLDSPVVMSQYGALPAIGALDSLATRRGQTNQLFTIVGYGDQAIVPFPEWQPVRHYGTPQLVSLDSALTGGFNIHLSGNPGRRAPGGACFGDSGGPSLVGDTNIVGGVASFVLSPTCTGASVYYRVDTADAQEFITLFLE
jgi:hypothetical protein